MRLEKVYVYDRKILTGEPCSTEKERVWAGGPAPPEKTLNGSNPDYIINTKSLCSLFPFFIAFVFSSRRMARVPRYLGLPGVAVGHRMNELLLLAPYSKGNQREALPAVLSLLCKLLPCFVATWWRDAPAVLVVGKEEVMCCVVEVHICARRALSGLGTSSTTSLLPLHPLPTSSTRRTC